MSGSDAKTGTHMGSGWVEVDDAGNTAPGALNSQTSSGELAREMQRRMHQSDASVRGPQSASGAEIGPHVIAWRMIGLRLYALFATTLARSALSTHSPFQLRNIFVMRAIWKGSISFGLVNIPIALYPATRKEELKFRLLRAKDLSPVNYKRVAEKDGKEVPWDEIVKGYEYEKGKYVVLKDEDFQRVDLEATQTVDIQDFVDQEEIDPIFFYKPYYLEPQKGGDKAYVLLRETLQKTGKVGIAKVVIKTRQYLAGVKAKDSVLVLELMHFAEELADADKLHIPKKLEAGKRELDMAKALVDSMSSKWDPKKYRDDYREALMEVIEEKVEAGGKEIEEKPKPKPRPSTKVIDLVSVLQESLNKTKKSHHARKSSAATRHRKAA